MEHVLWIEGFDGRSMTWEHLGTSVGSNAKGRTIRRAMGQKGYRQCIACRRGFVDPKLAKKRKKWAEMMLKKWPTKEHSRQVRFSDETHFGFGSQGRIYIIRKGNERACPDCVQEAPQPADKDMKRLHTWGAIGYDFKSNLMWYEVPTNKNGKMTLQVYRDEILEKEVKHWKGDFILEEDGDLGHGTGKSNIVRTWKEEHHLPYYFNCAHSPDFSPCENAWQAPKQWLRKYAHWDDETTYELAAEGWDRLTQKTINEWIDSMPERLQRCIDADGKLTAY